MKAKVPGECTKCDAEVFEVVVRDSETRIPTKLGPPTDDAVRVTFRLVKGSSMDLTFCRHCAEGLDALDYPHIWNRVVQSGVEQAGIGHPGVKVLFDDGILAIDRKQLWKEVA